MKNYFYKIVVKKKNLTGNSLLLCGLKFFSFTFLILVKLRVFLYRHRIIRRYRLSVPVISIGNITAGGSGKTPFVETLSKIIKEKFDKRVAVLMRGYGSLVQMTDNRSQKTEIGKQKSNFFIDEEAVLREKLDDVIILTGKNRIETGKKVVEEFRTECIVLDDGFQYLKMIRDLDIVLMKATAVLKEKNILPAGLLREPYSHLNRADILVLTDVDRVKNEEVKNIRKFVSKFFHDTFILEAVYEPKRLYDAIEEKYMDIDSISGNLFLSVCGISDPDSFRFTLSNIGISPAGTVVFPDHYEYKNKDIEYILNKANHNNIDCIITTLKDIYKIKPFINKFREKNVCKIYALDISLSLKPYWQEILYDKLSDLFNSKIFE